MKDARGLSVLLEQVAAVVSVFHNQIDLRSGGTSSWCSEEVAVVRLKLCFGVRLLLGGLSTVLPFQLTFRRQDVAPIDANFLMDSAKRVYSLVHDLGRNYLVFRDMVDTTAKTGSSHWLAFFCGCSFDQGFHVYMSSLDDGQ